MPFVVIPDMKINLGIEEILKINFHQKTSTAHISILPHSCNENLKEIEIVCNCSLLC